MDDVETPPRKNLVDSWASGIAGTFSFMWPEMTFVSGPPVHYVI